MICSGEKEAFDAVSNNFHASLAKDFQPNPTNIFPPEFFGTLRRRKPVLVLQGAIHGDELTGTVAMLNLCQIIETGLDLRGKSWPQLRALALETRLVMIPWLNIDGATRCPIPNTAGISEALYQRCNQGVMKDGTHIEYSSAKPMFPIPPHETAFLGTYYNDGG